MLTTYFKNLIADNVWHTQGDNASDIPAQYYLALSTTAPQEDGTGVTEPTATPYERKAMPAMEVAQDGTTTNAVNLVWPRFETTQSDPVAFWALYDAKTDGNLLMGGPLDAAKHLDIGTSLLFEAGSLVFNVLGV